MKSISDVRSSTPEACQTAGKVAAIALALFLVTPLLDRSMLGDDQLVWKPQGPGPNTRGQVEGIADEEVEGAVRAIAPHPTNPNIAYIGAVNGGIWKTANAMDAKPTWRHLTDAESSQAMGAIEFDPLDSTYQTLVAGTGRFSSLSSEGGARTGILRTTNAGSSWTALDGNGALKGLNISAIAARGPIIVLSANAADDPARAGLWRSTDAGVTWTRLSGSSDSHLPDGPSADLAGDSTNRGRFYTAAGFSGLYMSLDTGASWHKVSDLQMDALLANADNLKIAVGGGNNIFVAIDVSRHLAGVFHSGDGGSTWTSLELPAAADGGIHPGAQGDTHLSLTADPGNGHLVYIGGDRQDGDFDKEQSHVVPNAIGARDYTGRLFRGDVTRPPGTIWVHLTHSNALGPVGGGTAHGTAPHADSRGMRIAANGALVEVDDGGVYKRTSPDTNQGDWFSMNGDIQTTEFHSVAWDPNVHLIIGGAQDTGAPQQNVPSNVRWESVTEGDGGVVAVDSSSTAGLSVRYSSYYGFGRFRRRVYDGHNVLRGQVFPQLTVIPPGEDVVPQFYTPVKLNAISPSRLIIGYANGVYESDDQGDSLTEIAPMLRVNGDGVNPIAYGAAGNPDVLYVGSYNSVFVRTAAHPAPLTRSAAYTGGRVIGLSGDVSTPSKAFVVDPTNVFGTTDTGTTWSMLTGNLVNLAPGALRSVEHINLAGRSVVVVGADRGVYYAKGPHYSKWSKFGSDLPVVPVFHLEYSSQDKVLLAGTFGRGAWTLTIPTLSTLVAQQRLAAPSQQASPAHGEGSAAFRLGNGVVVNPAKHLAYVANPEGGITAISLKSGERAWSTKEASKPIGMSADKVIAQADPQGTPHRLKVVVLDSSNGHVVSSATTDLPAHVIASTSETLHGAFEASAAPVGNDAVLSWQYHEHPRKGVSPETKPTLSPDRHSGHPAVLAPSPSSPDRGAFRLDLAAGVLNPIPGLSPSVPRTPQSIHRAPVEQIPGVTGPRLPSVDGADILVSSRTGNDSNPAEKYTLSVYERPSLKKIGQFTSPLSVRAFIVVGPLILFQTPPMIVGDKTEPTQIKAVDLTTGREKWAQPIRDTVYRGAYPP